MNKKINIEDIIKLVKTRNIIWTKHCLNRINQRDILIKDIKTAICNGKIIEYYYEDYPYPSCLIAGRDINCNLIHIVCGINNNFVYMITAYYPNTNKWEDDMKTRRENNGMF